MKTRAAGGDNLYDAEKDASRHAEKLAVICYLTDQDPTNIDGMRIDYAAVKIRQMWKYSSDIRGSLEGDYSNNAIPRLLAKTNVKLTSIARESYWNYKLAKAAENGQ